MKFTQKRHLLRRSICSGPLLSALFLSGTALAQTAGSSNPGAGSNNSANGNSLAQEQAVQSAIPLTPAMITQLAQRYQANHLRFEGLRWKG